MLLNYVLSDPYVDVALVGTREPRFVDFDNEMSDNVASRIDLAQLHGRCVSQGETRPMQVGGFFPALLGQGSEREQPKDQFGFMERVSKDFRFFYIECVVRSMMSS